MAKKEQIITLCVTWDDQDGDVTVTPVGVNWMSLVNCCGGMSGGVYQVSIESMGPIVDKRT